MEKNSEISEIIKKHTKNADYSGHSEKEIDQDVDRRTGQVQQQKRSQTLTQKAVVMALPKKSDLVRQKGANPSNKKKIVTVFQKTKKV